MRRACSSPSGTHAAQHTFGRFLGIFHKVLYFLSDMKWREMPLYFRNGLSVRGVWLATFRVEHQLCNMTYFWVKGIDQVVLGFDLISHNRVCRSDPGLLYWHHSRSTGGSLWHSVYEEPCFWDRKAKDKICNRKQSTHDIALRAAVTPKLAVKCGFIWWDWLTGCLVLHLIGYIYYTLECRVILHREEKELFFVLLSWLNLTCLTHTIRLQST